MARSRHKGEILRGILICCGCDEPILCRVWQYCTQRYVWDLVGKNVGEDIIAIAINGLLLGDNYIPFCLVANWTWERVRGIIGNHEMDK